MKNLLKYLAIFAAAFAISGAAVYFGIGLFTQSADEVILPELKGKNIIYVLGTLTEMGLNVKLYGTEYHETVPKYSVIAQDPEPGSTIKKGRDVIIYLSKGEKRAVMPDLRGMKLARAEILLEKNDFFKQRVSRTVSQTVPSEHVIAQYPRAFSTTPRQTGCSLLVSSGPRPIAYVMPDLRGLPMETAGAMLSRLRVPLEKIQSQKTRDVSAGQVIRQMPENGGRVTRKTPVTLIVSSNEDDRTMNPEHLNRMVLILHHLEPGFLRQHVRVETDMFGHMLNLYDELMKPGTRIPVLAPADKKSVINIYVDGQLARAITIDPWKADHITGENQWELSPPQFYQLTSPDLEMN